MARTEITIQERTRETTGAITWEAIGTDGKKYQNTGVEWVLFKRDAASTSTITVATNYEVDGITLGNLSIAMAAGDSDVQIHPLPPLPKGTYNQSGGFVNIDSDDTTNDDVAVIKEG